MLTKATHDYPPETVDGVAITYRSLDRYPTNLFGDDGWVWSRASTRGMGKKWRRLKGSIGPTGYRLLSLRDRDGVKRWENAHRLILEAHVGPCPEGKEACHDPDPNRLNNRLSNLRWDTRSANGHDTYRHQRRPLKITVAGVHEVRRLRREGWTYQRIADLHGVTLQAVWLICKGKNRSTVPIEPTATTS